MTSVDGSSEPPVVSQLNPDVHEDSIAGDSRGHRLNQLELNPSSCKALEEPSDDGSRLKQPDQPLKRSCGDGEDRREVEPASTLEHHEEKDIEKVVPKETPVDVPFSTFSTGEKKVIILAASVATFISPLTSNIYFPALNTLAKDLHVSISKINLSITTYMV